MASSYWCHYRIFTNFYIKLEKRRLKNRKGRLNFRRPFLFNKRLKIFLQFFKNSVHHSFFIIDALL